MDEKYRLNLQKMLQRKKIALVPEERAIQGLFLNLGIDYNISIPSIGKLTSGILVNRKKEHDLVGEYMKILEIKAANEQSPARELSEISRRS